MSLTYATAAGVDVDPLDGAVVVGVVDGVVVDTELGEVGKFAPPPHAVNTVAAAQTGMAIQNNRVVKDDSARNMSRRFGN